MSYFGFANYVSPPRSPVEGRKSPVRSPIIPFKTSPSQLNEVSTCPDFTFSNSLRSPEGPTRGRSVKEFEDQLASLKKENFNLKIRIYFLEERMGANFNLDKENVLKKNVELMVEIESLKKELQEKHDLLCQAVKAMDLEEDEFKKTAQAKNDEILALKQEMEELKQQLQEGKYETDDDSGHKSYRSEPLFFTSETGGKVRMLQERIVLLENELVREKENCASLQMIVDRSDSMNARLEELQSESSRKDETISNLRKDLASAKDSVAKLSVQMKDIERNRDDFKLETQRLSRLLLEKSKAVEESEEHVAEVKKKYSALKVDLEKERQKSERAKLVGDMKVAELEEEAERLKQRVQDLQKRLGAAGHELKENQNLLVPKSPNGRPAISTTDRDNVSVPHAAASPGVQKEDALRDALAAKSPSKSPVSPKTFDFNLIFKLLNPIAFKTKPQLLRQLDELKDTLTASEQKIVKLKAQELKACALIKNLMQYHKNAEDQNQAHAKRIAQLERELEGVVSKPEAVAARSNNKAQEKVDSSKDDECKELVRELENKLQILELTLKEKNVHLQYVEARNLELQDRIKEKETDLIELEASMSSVGEKNRETSEKTYSKLFDEKNREIEKLNEELKKRTHDLQTVVNQELWQKNREIEKLQIKYAQLLETKERELVELKESFSALSSNLNELRNENEEKHIENTNLKIDISDLRLQLQLLRDKIGEIGLIPDEKLEVEIIISSLDEVKNIQKQLEDVKTEKEALTKKIDELQGTLQMYEGSNELEALRKELKTSEALRIQTTEVCQILRAQLEELAIFLDSLMKQKSVLGFLGSTQNRRLREAIDQSLDLSKSLNLSLSMNPEQSLMQLSNLTSLLNCSGLSNQTMTDSNRYSFSIAPEQATITYQSHLFRIDNDEEERQNREFLVKSLEDQIEMLQRELSLKDAELGKYRRESKSIKESRTSKPRISPNKLRNCVTVRSEHQDSESEVWSEPDVNVSKARIGLFEDKEVGIQEIQSSDSTDESLTQLDYKRSDILNECQVTITKLSKQVQELQGKLKEKENDLATVQEVNSIKEHNAALLVKVKSLESELEESKFELEKAERIKNDIEEEMRSFKEELKVKDEEDRVKQNRMDFERDQLVNLATQYVNMIETSRQEIVELENKLTQVSIEKENMTKEYEDKLTKEAKNFEKQLKKVEARATEGMNEMSVKMAELAESYADKTRLIDSLNLELDVLRGSLEDAKKAASLSELMEKSLKEEINGLREKLSRVESQLAEAEKERVALKKECDKGLQIERTYLDTKREFEGLKETYEKDVNSLVSLKSKLELKVSELEFSNADLHNRLARLQAKTNENGRGAASSPPVLDSNRSVPINQVTPYSRQVSQNEEEARTRGPFSIVVPQKSLDSERVESNASPDLGIESDQGRFSSLEAQVSRPLQQTIEIAESMNNLLDGDNNSLMGTACDNKSCYQKSQELYQENNNLKKKLSKTRKALEDTVTQLTIANQRKKLVEKNICRQIHKTSQVLREAKANLDSGSETDFHKK